MERENKFRYDPLYRVIDVPNEANIVEGSFRNLFGKLKNINNLGIIPTVLEMAKYSKYEHHFGGIQAEVAQPGKARAWSLDDSSQSARGALRLGSSNLPLSALSYPAVAALTIMFTMEKVGRSAL